MRSPLEWWRARRRRIDIEVLWPQLKRTAASPFRARQAFALHVNGDPAWRALDEAEVKSIIDGLK